MVKDCGLCRFTQAFTEPRAALFIRSAAGVQSRRKIGRRNTAIAVLSSACVAMSVGTVAVSSHTSPAIGLLGAVAETVCVSVLTGPELRMLTSTWVLLLISTAPEPLR